MPMVLIPARVLLSHPGTFARLLDICRFTIECDNMDVLAAVVGGLTTGSRLLRMIRLKNRLEPRRTSFAGYRDILTNMVLTGAAFAFEVQVSLEPYLMLKAESHEVYDGARQSTLSLVYHGAINANTNTQLAAGGIQECDVGGTACKEELLTSFLVAVQAPSSRLTMLCMNGCHVLKYKDLSKDILTPAVCKGQQINLLFFAENLLESTDGVLRPPEEHPSSVLSGKESLLPSASADVRVF